MTRIQKEKLFSNILALLTLFACFILAFILFAVFSRGFSALSWEFISSEATDFGAQGGILYQIFGTLLLMFAAITICLPIALGTALYQSEYLKSSFFQKAFKIFMASLNGMPTIVLGLAGYLFFGKFLGIGVSWLTGALILSAMILPTAHAAILEAIETLPEHYQETGISLGLKPNQRILAVVIPHSVYGIVTGALLGLARAGGETAAIMFTATAFSGVTIPQSITEPVATLQTHILVLAQEATNPTALANAWGATSVLLGIVFFLILGAKSVRSRLSWEPEQ
jgi:phosphate transport system permease protein